jgi:hypothetical protein
MTATNRSRAGTTTYEIQADGIVRKDAAGRYVEEYAWSKLTSNDAPATLDAAAKDFRQSLSLDPNYPLSVPDLSHVLPLIGPITDLLTFYADMLVARQGQLTRAGDHFYFKRGTPSSWADGNYVILGQDSIDFDVTLVEVNTNAQTLTIKVRHVPPEKPEINLPADWMRSPVADTPNNWVQVTKLAGTSYAAEVGKETFDVLLKVSLVNGQVLSGTIDNPVEILERDCSNAALTACGKPARYQINREIQLN